MLVLARNINESIIIADCIHIKLLSIDINKVRLGFNAPFDIKILREEIYQKENFKPINAYQHALYLPHSNHL